MKARCVKFVKPICLILLVAAAASAAAVRPNILFLFTDDQALNTLGIYGNEQVKTPNIDRLGTHGLVFDRHYNTTAICMASRANVMSGLYEYKSGCNFLHGPMGTKQWATSYPILLKQAGYRTGFAGKFGFSVSDTQLAKGDKADGGDAVADFDFWKGGTKQTSYVTKENRLMGDYAAEYPHSTRSYAAASIDFMRESVKSGQPFCMTLFYKASHEKFAPDPLFDDVYKDTVWKRPANFGPEAGAHLASQSRGGRQVKIFKQLYQSDADYQATQRKYNQLIYGVDFSIGMIRDELELLGVAENTIIIYSSDNGYYQGAHGFGGKVLPYEEGAKVPLIIYDPRNPQRGVARRSDSLSGNVDITATILDYAGVPIPGHYDGKSLVPVLTDETAEVRQVLPIIQVWGPEQTRCLSILHKDYKYVHWYSAGKGAEPTDELFNLTKDPMEMTNLAAHPEAAPVLAQMKKLYSEQVAVWKAEAVEINGYQQYGELFDLSIPWEQKANLLKQNATELDKGEKKSRNKTGA